MLAGSHPAGFEQMAEAAGATATGWVPDMVQLYEPGTVLIVPLLGGSGTRVKILEAWSLGVPVIATPQGAAGLGARDGVELLLARTPEEWASACRRLTSPGVVEAHRRWQGGVASSSASRRMSSATQLQDLLRRRFDLPRDGRERVSGEGRTARAPARQARLGTVLSAALTARLYGGTDKVSHGYLPYYDRHLGRRRYRRLVVIEIGVGGDELGPAQRFATCAGATTSLARPSSESTSTRRR